MNQSILRLNTFMLTTTGVLTGCVNSWESQELRIIGGSIELCRSKNR